MSGVSSPSRRLLRDLRELTAALGWRVRRAIGIAVALALLPTAAGLSAERVAQDPRDRVAHHLREAEAITRHFEAVLGADCPQLASRQAWDAYLETEVDRAVLLVAHLKQAWREARRTEDEDLRRIAREPRGRVHQAGALVEKLRYCAGDSGDVLAPLELWRRLERDVPRRQAEIRLPR